jgi:hypothetical protein
MHLDLKNASDGLDLNQLDGLDSGILAWRQFHLTACMSAGETKGA